MKNANNLGKPSRKTGWGGIPVRVFEMKQGRTSRRKTPQVGTCAGWTSERNNVNKKGERREERSSVRFYEAMAGLCITFIILPPLVGSGSCYSVGECVYLCMCVCLVYVCASLPICPNLVQEGVHKKNHKELYMKLNFKKRHNSTQKRKEMHYILFCILFIFTSERRAIHLFLTIHTSSQ